MLLEYGLYSTLRDGSVWLTPRGGSMVGSFRWVFPDGRQVLDQTLGIQLPGVDALEGSVPLDRVARCRSKPSRFRRRADSESTA